MILALVFGLVLPMVTAGLLCVGTFSATRGVLRVARHWPPLHEWLAALLGLNASPARSSCCSSTSWSGSGSGTSSGSGQPASRDTRTILFGLYGSWTMGPLHVDAAASYGRARFSAACA